MRALKVCDESFEAIPATDTGKPARSCPVATSTAWAYQATGPDPPLMYAFENR